MHGKDTHKHPSSFASDAECAQLGANGNGVWKDQILLTVEELAEILRVPKSWIYSHQDRSQPCGSGVTCVSSDLKSSRFWSSKRLANDTV